MAVYHYRKVIPLEKNNNPNKSEYQGIRDEFVKFLKDTAKDPSLIDNNKRTNQILDKIQSYKFSIFSMLQVSSENNRTHLTFQKESLHFARNSTPSFIFQ